MNVNVKGGVVSEIQKKINNWHFFAELFASKEKMTTFASTTSNFKLYLSFSYLQGICS